MSVILGKDVETGRTLAVGDTERCGGLYLLGKPRTGKSTLLISLALQDIEHGHGLLFIDPHTDAIAALLVRIPDKRAKDVILLDPMTEEYAFGINPLTCKNPKSYKELAFSYGLARDVFVKVFGNPQTGELGILLDKYLRNTLYPLLENPGYTLVDIESFLINPLFRNRLLQNVSMNPAVVRFWQEQYEQLPYKDQIEERESTLNRLNIILAEPHVRHIVGQVKTTIDFTEILRTQKIVLLRMPAGMDEGIKTFIGTLIISQLLKAVWLRQEMPEEARGLFALYCDEFQHFATPDFAKLFTQTGKFKIMPTVAHQERLGQFKPQDPNRGATLAAPNKVLFSLSVADSKELAPEFAKPHPTETRREQELVISQNPVSDLLRGHSNPQIRAFVNQYLRPLQERAEDIREDMELERLTRDDYRDRAGIERILAQINAPKSRYADNSAQLAALEAAMSSLLFARTQTEKLASFLKSSKELRQTIRGFNRFLTGIIEGRISRGQEIFSQFLIAITRVHEFSLVPEEYRPVLELYLSLQYGDPRIPRAIPFNFAKGIQLFSDTAAALQREAEEKAKRERDAFLQEQWAPFYEKEREGEAYSQEYRLERQEKFIKEFSPPTFTFGELNDLPTPTHRVYFDSYMNFGERWLDWYRFLYEYPSVVKLLEPFYTARFAPSWKSQLPHCDRIANWLLSVEQFCRGNSLRALEYFNYYHQMPFKRWLPGLIHGEPVYDEYFRWNNLFELDLLDGFRKFIRQYGEGAIVVLVLFETLRYLTQWLKSPSSDSSPINMLHLPALVNREPLEIFTVLGKLADLLPRLNFEEDLRKYQWFCPEYLSHHWVKDKPRGQPRPLISLNKDSFVINWNHYMGKLEKRLDMQLLNQLLAQSRHSLLQEGWWKSSEKLTQLYLKARACDIASYGKKGADLSFPQPTLQGASSSQVAQMVDFMAELLEGDERQKENQRRQARYAKHEQKVLDELEHERELHNKFLPVPITSLAPWLLSRYKIDLTLEACRNQFLNYDREKSGNLVQGTLKAIEEFVQFCTLLSKPENQIKVPSGQYIEREVTTRSFVDMEAEMAWALANLAKYTAYIRFTEEQGGAHTVVKQQMKTYPLPPVPDGRDVSLLEKHILDQTYLHYCKKRQDIEREISQRQKTELTANPNTSPSTQVESKEETQSPSDDTPPPTSLSPGSTSQESDQPPPTSVSASTSEAGAKKQEVAEHKTVNETQEMRLIYQSNFDQPDKKLREYDDGDGGVFRKDGYLHMSMRSYGYRCQFLGIDLADFRLYFDAEFIKSSNETDDYGIKFRVYGLDTFCYTYYSFRVSRSGYYSLWFSDREWGEIYGGYIIKPRFSDLIRRGNNLNILMVEMVGEKITLGVNGMILDTVMDDHLTSGYFLLDMGSKDEDSSVKEVRFRNFRLYSI